MKEKEIEILDRALNVFAEATEIKIQIESYEHKNSEGYFCDAAANLTVGDFVIPLVIEIKLKPTAAVVMPAKRMMTDRQVLIVADYVNPSLAELLKEQGIWFLDTGGNSYIKHLPVFIYIKGNKPVENLKVHINRAFRPSGLKVIYAFLSNPKLVNATYREIAETADVALGTVGWTINDLIQTGFIVDMGDRGRRLKEKRKLLERWLVSYAEKLRPKLERGRYKASTADWWQTASLQSLQAYWGGEVAADKLTHYLKPEIITLYLPEKHLTKLLLSHKLRKDPAGNIELLETFWHIDNDESICPLVNPILIYADLIASGDSRNIETAKIIYEQELAEHFSED